MSDLFSPLREPEHLAAPPVEQVRRRGDALRRRHSAAVTATVAVAVVGILLSGALLAGGTAERSSEPPIATQAPEATASPTASPSAAATTVPADIELARGLDDPGSDGEVAEGPRVNWLADLVVCDAAYSPADTATDHTAVLWQVPQLNVGRDLRVYADASDARASATELVQRFRACPTFTPAGGATRARNEVSNLGSPGAAWLVTQTFTTDGQPQFGQVIVVVEQLGSSVLVARQDSEGPGSTDRKAMLRTVRDFIDSLSSVRYQIGCALQVASCS